MISHGFLPDKKAKNPPNVGGGGRWRGQVEGVTNSPAGSKCCAHHSPLFGAPEVDIPGI